MASLHHVRSGSGPPLLLVHGTGMDWRAWEPVMPALERRRDVVSVDLPGFGLTPPLPAGVRPTVWAIADAVERFAHELSLERPHVAGNSLGGAIALELARRRAVASATAISPIGFWTARERRWCQASLREGRRAALALRPALPAATRSAGGRTVLLGQNFGKPWRMPPHVAQRVPDRALDAPAFLPVIDAFDDYVFARGHELAGVPVTVAWGKRDWLLLPREGRRVGRALPSARFVWLGNGCGHVPCWDDPALVAGVLLEGSRRSD